MWSSVVNVFSHSHYAESVSVFNLVLNLVNTTASDMSLIMQVPDTKTSMQASS